MRKFIAKLPDRGNKILDYTEKVRAAIAQHNRQKETTALLSAFKLQFQEQRRNIKENAETSEVLVDKVTQVSLSLTEGKANSSDHASAYNTQASHNLDAAGSSASVEINEEPCRHENPADALANSLKMINIKESGDEASKGSLESGLGTSGLKKPHYIEVIERRSMSPVRRKETFRTNRLPDSDSSTPDQSPGDKALLMSAEQRKLHDRKHLDDITAARLPPLHHSPAQLLPIEESLSLQMAQKKIYEEKEAMLSAQKLFEKLNIKMGPFNPEGDSYMKYRDHEDDDKFGADQ
ncbi:protein GRINL1A isoform 2-T2 [Leptodactylus fuscus]|uniref:protein GRINL1A isoform X2 n=1 Tax=Leptodactylus fuscus TaxID=238119 RepID=UPI003F4E7D19